MLLAIMSGGGEDRCGRMEMLLGCGGGVRWCNDVGRSGVVWWVRVVWCGNEGGWSGA